MIFGTPTKMDIQELIKCPTTRAELFKFYKNQDAERKHFEKLVNKIEKGEEVYFSQKWFAFYDQEGNLLAGENPAWGE